jgi:hypothetical protein
MATEEDRRVALAFVRFVSAAGDSKAAIKGQIAEYKRLRDAGRTMEEILGLAEADDGG